MGTSERSRRLLIPTLFLIAWGPGCVVSPYLRELSPHAVEMLGQGPADYGDRNPSDPAWHSDRYAAEFLQMLPPSVPGCRHSSALDRMAATLATAYAETDVSPTWDLLRWIGWTAGMPAPPDLRFHVARWQGRDPLESTHPERTLKKTAAALTSRDAPCVFGVAGAYPTYLVNGFAIVVGREVVQFDAFPRQARPGEVVTIVGHARVPLANMHGYLDKGPGVDVTEVVTGDDGHFEIVATMPKQPGRWFVSLDAKEAACIGQKSCARREVAVLPIDVGVPAPFQPDEIVRHPRPNPDDPDQWAQQLVDDYNGARAVLHLAPLRVDRALSTRAAERLAAIVEARATSEKDLSPGKVETDDGSPARITWAVEPRPELVHDLARLQLQDPLVRVNITHPNARYFGWAMRRLADGKRYQAVEYLAADATKAPGTEGGSPAGGLRSSQIQDVVRQHDDEIKQCYQHELEADPTLAGEVVLAWVVGPSGDVTKVSIKKSGLHNSAAENCMLVAIRAWTFPKPASGGIVNVNYPFIFKSQ